MIKGIVAGVVGGLIGTWAPGRLDDFLQLLIARLPSEVAANTIRPANW